MEKISEKAGRSRGRPPRFAPCIIEDEAHFVFGHWYSHRADVNHQYNLRASDVLQAGLVPGGEFSWLGIHGVKRRNTILSELGRFWYSDRIRAAARIVCENRLKTADAVRVLRNLRLSRRHPPGSANGMIDEIANVALNYVRLHDPRLSDSEIVTAFEEARERVLLLRDVDFECARKRRFAEADVADASPPSDADAPARAGEEEENR